jgi:PAS domain S-box-containing protein
MAAKNVANGKKRSKIGVIRPRHKSAFLILMTIALVMVVGAVAGIADGFRRIATATDAVEASYRTIAAAENILTIARDSETGQRGYLLTGNERYLEPFNAAQARAPRAWARFNALPLGAEQAAARQEIHKSFDQKFARSAMTVSMRRKGQVDQALRAVDIGIGRELMDRLRAQVDRFQAVEERKLLAAHADADTTFRDAMVQAILGAMGLLAAGALGVAALRRARTEVDESAALVQLGNQRFKATFDQSTVGKMLLNTEGYPMLVNDALCRMTGYSRAEFLSATPDSPAFPKNLFSDPASCDALLDGEIDSYQHEMLANTKDGGELCLSTLMSAVRANDGSIDFLSALVTDLTEQRAAELKLKNSEARLRGLQAEFAHIARVNDLGEMAAAIAHEINQPLTAITNYMSVGQKLATIASETQNDLQDVLQRASDQAQRASHIVKRMRSFVERTDEARGTEQVGALIDSSTELVLIGHDRSTIDILRAGDADELQVLVDAIQIQQVLVILIRNAIEAFGKSDHEARLRRDDHDDRGA